MDAAYRRNLQTDRYDYVSPVIERITGFTADEMGIEEALECIRPDDRPLAAAEIEHTMNDGWGIVEYMFRCKDRTVSLARRSIQGDQG